jgi:hypothetical protein
MSDLLTVYCNMLGRPLLEPSGTYSYGSESTLGSALRGPSRNYFRGPGAHNGVVLRGHDPLGEATTRFRTGDNGTRVSTSWRGLDGVLGWVEGRLKEAGPLNGYRRGVVNVPRRYMLIYDCLPALPSAANVACHWQFAPEADIASLQGRKAVVACKDMAAYLCASNGIAALDARRGRSEPPAGWVSRRYGELTPAPQLICQVEPGARNVAFACGLASEEGDPPDVSVVDGGEGGPVIEVRHGGLLDVFVIGRFAGCLRGQFCDIDVRGEIAWLQFEGEYCLEVRGLGLRHFSSKALSLELEADGLKAMQIGWCAVASERGVEGLSGQWRTKS